MTERYVGTAIIHIILWEIKCRELQRTIISGRMHANESNTKCR